MLVWLYPVNIAEGIAETVQMTYREGGVPKNFTGFTATWQIITEGVVWASGSATLGDGTINVQLSEAQTRIPKPARPQKLGAAGVLEVIATSGATRYVFNAAVILARREDLTTTGAGIGYQAPIAPAPPVVSPLGAGTPVEAYGAVGDGVTDDRAAFILAEASGIRPILLTQDYYLSSNTGGTAGLYDLGGNASVTMGTGAFGPNRYIDNKAKTFDRKQNVTATNPAPIAQFYTNLNDAPQHEMFWINQWGYQEPDTDGNYSGSNLGPFPPGQTRLARTGAQQLHLRGSHSGMGDGYNVFASMAVTPHGATPITFWSGGNSGGVLGFQVNAIGAKVNLYGCGDMVLDDKGHADVALLGNVSILYRAGANSGAYQVPRFNYLAVSGGANDLDHAYGVTGKYFVGLDLSAGDYSSDFGVTLAADQRIGFDAGSRLSGKFTTQGGGLYWIDKPAASPLLRIVAANNPTFQVRADRVEVAPDAETAYSLRVRGSSATASVALGQIGTNSFITALTTGTEATNLNLQASDASGTETVVLKLVGLRGVLSVDTMPTYANNAAAVSGGLLAGDIYKTSTGELRIRI